MASHAPQVSESFDPILAAAAHAPLVPLTAEERALLDEAESGPLRWLSHEEFVSRLPVSGDDR
jgi:hypothetical protein